MPILHSLFDLTRKSNPQATTLEASKVTMISLVTKIKFDNNQNLKWCLSYTNHDWTFYAITNMENKLLCVFLFWVLCCDVRYDFNIETMFVSSLPPVVCRRAHVLFTLFEFVYIIYVVVFFVFCFFLVLCTLCCQFLWIGFVFFGLVCPMLPVSLGCPFWLPLRYSLMFI